MLIPAAAWEALLEAGAQLSAHDAGYVDIWVSDDSGGRRTRAKVKSSSNSVGPAQVWRLRESVPAGEHLVLIAPMISPATQDALAAEGWSWIAVPRDGARATGLLRLPGLEAIEVGGDQQTAGSVRHTPTGRTPWGRFTAIRNLLTRAGSWSQTELAHASSISQPRASQILSELMRDGLVERSMYQQPGEQHRRWQVSSWDNLLDRWLDTYPGPGGVTTYWFGLDAISHQASQVVEALTAERQDDHSAPVVSGDAAAEFIAPYSRPQRAVVYSRWGADLNGAGLTPVGPDEATLELIVPEDNSMWPRSDSRPLGIKAPFGIADPIQVIWDLQRAPGMDSDQAADAVRDVVRRYVAEVASK